MCPQENKFASEDGVPPLYYATAARDAEIVRLLLNSGKLYKFQLVLIHLDEVGMREHMPYPLRRCLALEKFLSNYIYRITSPTVLSEISKIGLYLLKRCIDKGSGI